MTDTSLPKINKLINSTTTEGLAYSLERSDRLVNLIPIMVKANEITIGMIDSLPGIELIGPTVNTFVMLNKSATTEKVSAPAPPTINPEAIDDSFIASSPFGPLRPYFKNIRDGQTEGGSYQFSKIISESSQMVQPTK